MPFSLLTWILITLRVYLNHEKYVNNKPESIRAIILQTVLLGSRQGFRQASSPETRPLRLSVQGFTFKCDVGQGCGFRVNIGVLIITYYFGGSLF